MRIEDALEQLGRQIGLTLRLDPAKSCRLVFDRAIAVDIEALEDGARVYLSTVVGRLTAGDDGTLLKELLEANLFGRGTGRSVLGIDAGLKEIVLHRGLDMAATDYAQFTAALEDFLTHARAWTERLAKRRPAAGSSTLAGSETFVRI
jgi:hypothetical protein